MKHESEARASHQVARQSVLIVNELVLGVVAGLKNGELVMAGVVGGDCRDKMADRLPRSYR